MGKDVIIACDFSSKEETLKFLDLFKDKKPFVKIGMELFYAEGPDIVKELKERGHKVFLDLKLHDIPNTVKKAMSVLANLKVDMINVHAGGTKKMMEAALEGLSIAPIRPILIAVTQLTSTDQESMENDLLIKERIDEVVMHYAKNAKDSNLDGVVCSPLEAKKVHDICGKDFLTITPGIRLDTNNNNDDQKRIMTPKDAKEIGSDYIVVGRPITKANNPVEVYNQCYKDFVE